MCSYEVVFSGYKNGISKRKCRITIFSVVARRVRLVSLGFYVRLAARKNLSASEVWLVDLRRALFFHMLVSCVGFSLFFSFGSRKRRKQI